MYTNPLLQQALPPAAKPLPRIWATGHNIHARDEVRISVEGVGTIPVPPLVMEAMRELEDFEHKRKYYHKEVFNAMNYQPHIVLLLLCIRYNDFNYVACEPVRIN